MLIIAFLVAAFNLASSAPVLPPTADLNVTPTSPLVIFGRELPDCTNVARYRTMQDIVLSCLATIFACTWVAIHPNVPRPEDSGWQRLKLRIAMMIYAILTPEFIIMWALRQRVGAAKNMKAYNENFYPSTTPPSHSIWWYIKCWFCGTKGEKPDKLWTITHGFLLEMGGLVDGRGEIVEYSSRIPHPLDIPEIDVSDKSKGDFLTKLLVLLQTTWFVFQCLARWITHLPVTELEVVTLAFALLNIGTFALWWNKPQNMTVAIRMDRYRKPREENEDSEEKDGDEALIRTFSEGGEDIPLVEDRPTPSSPGGERRPSLKGMSTQNTDEGHHLLGSGPKSEGRSPQRFALLVKFMAVMKQSVLILGALMVAMLMAFDPRRLRSLTFRHVWNFITAPLVPLMTMATHFPGHSSPYERIFDCTTLVDREVSFGLSTIGTLFGGLHLVPIWLSSFPSSPERFLWGISAGLITIAPSIFAGFAFREARTGRTSADNPLNFGALGLYLIARIILIILAFTTLREPPPDAFRNIAWTTFLPHW